MKTSIKATVNTTINASVESVWDALTKPEIIKKYFFGTDTITDWKAGSPIKFKGEWQGKKYEDKGKILDIEPKQLIRYEYWSPMSGIEDKPENYMVLTYKITGEDDDVHLSLLQENIPDEKTKEHSAENWKKVLGDMKKLLETGSIG